MSETFLQRRRVQRPGVVQLRKLIVTRAWADVTPRGSGPSRRENPAPTEGGA